MRVEGEGERDCDCKLRSESRRWLHVLWQREAFSRRLARRLRAWILSVKGIMNVSGSTREAGIGVKHTTDDLEKGKNCERHQQDWDELAESGRVVFRVAVVA